MNLILLIVCLLLLFYGATLLILMAGFARLRRNVEQRPSVSSENLPSVSIVVAARNEAHNLPRLLHSLFAQEYPADKLEIVVVDDRSEDGSWDMLQKAMHHHAHFRALRVADLLPDFAPKKRALDLGIRSASGEIVLLTDADCTPPATWAQAMARCYTGEANIVLGYSPYRFDYEAPFLVRGMLSLDYLSLAAVAAASAGWGRPLTATGTNLSYRREEFLRTNGFEKIKHWVSGDDDLFVHRAAEDGWGRFSFATAPESFVPAAAPSSWHQFANQRARYASKGRDYDLRITLGLLAVYLLNGSLVLGVVGVVGGISAWALPVFLVWCAKSLFEFLFLARVAFAFREQRLLFYFLPTALLHPWYVSIFGFAGLFGRFRWKGDDFRKTVEPPHVRNLQ